jgi:hypothetical protein
MLINKESKVNRKKFLQPYKEKFKNIESRGKLPYKEKFEDTESKKKFLKQLKKEKAEIIIELIKLEPSHLAESWILWEIIDWMKNYDCIDYLEEAFISQTGRDRKTPDKQDQVYFDFFLIQSVDDIIKKDGCTVKEACEELAQKQDSDPVGYLPKWDLENDYHNLAETIRQRYYSTDRNKYLKFCNERDKKRELMPYPYYGRDVIPKM